MGVSRRGVLKAALLGGAALGAGTALYRRFQDDDDDGLRREIEAGNDPAVNQYFEEHYDRPITELLTPGEQDLLIQTVRIGDADIEENVMRDISREFAEHDWNVHWLDYPETFSEELIAEQYSNYASTLLDDTDSFYAEQIDPIAKQCCIQLITTPYDEILHVEEDEGFAKTYGGYTMNDRIAVQKTPGARLTMHEIGHTGTLDHNFDPDYQYVMTREIREDTVLGYSVEEWETFEPQVDLHKTF